MVYLSVFVYVFGIFIHVDLLMPLDFYFFIFLDCLPCKPAPIARKSWMCGQNVSRK